MKYDLFFEVHPDWIKPIQQALSELSTPYLESLMLDSAWLPGPVNLFAAFSLPLQSLRFILLGESPYPRACSANGYAFWDAAVGNLWSETGLSKSVNRATSLRNLIKMLLVARGDLQHDTSQAAIAALSCDQYCQTASELFTRLIQQGFLLLNASLVYEEGEVRRHAKHWLPFMQAILSYVAEIKPEVEVLLFGKIAKQLVETCPLPVVRAEHPYNVSFIYNEAVLSFFKPLDVLNKTNEESFEQ
jgi:uracil-DNA glycosylase